MLVPTIFIQVQMIRLMIWTSPSSSLTKIFCMMHLEISPLKMTIYIVIDYEELEEQFIARFTCEGCRCKYYDGEPCCTVFSVDDYQRVRDDCRQLSHSELDLVVMGQLLALTQRDETTQTKHYSSKDRKRSFTCFKHGGHNICIKTFCFLHTIGQSKLEAIKASNGLCPRSRPYVKPHHALHLSDIEYVVSFVRNYADGRIPGDNDGCVEPLLHCCQERS